MTEPYQWVPANSADVSAFTAHVRGLTDKNATLTLTDEPSNFPATPAPPTFVVISDTSIAVTWVEPDDSGDPIVSYDLQYKLFVDSVWLDISNQTDLTETVTGLNAGTSYDFRVRATNGNGDSGWSLRAFARTQSDGSMGQSLYCVDATDFELWIVNPTTPGSSTLAGAFPSGLSRPSGFGLTRRRALLCRRCLAMNCG